ncbi:MAG: PhzF family phenazine biosynthesis protein [Pseudomonadota bacterium]
MLVHQLQCFGLEPGTGNTALVIEHDDKQPAARQAFARQQNRSACVFIDGATLDYYYPHMRSPLCLHATLAAAHILFAARPQATRIGVTTALRGQPLQLVRGANGLYIELRRQPAPKPALPAALVASLLNAELVSAPLVASVGSAKLLLEVADRAALQALRPDLARIAAWGQAEGVNGCYVYCRRADGTFEGRNFNHLDPALEDRATGVAAGALTAVLQRGLTLFQTDCRIDTRLDGDAILVGGATELMPA